jgi:uncharacterized protein (TIGR00269 family)
MMKFPVVYKKCPCSIDAYRREYREILNDFEKRHPPIKHNIISFFLRTIYRMKEDEKGLKQEQGEINACAYCGEPCSKDVCKRCEILIAIKGKEK